METLLAVGPLLILPIAVLILGIVAFGFAATDPRVPRSLFGASLGLMVVSLGFGPLLVYLVFAVMDYVDDSRPYERWDVVLGEIYLAAAVMAAVFTWAVWLLRRRGYQYDALLPGADWGHVLLWAFTAMGCGLAGGVTLAARGQTCQDEYCWYELVSVPWMALSVLHWIVALVSFVVNLVARRRQQRTIAPATIAPDQGWA